MSKPSKSQKLGEGSKNYNPKNPYHKKKINTSNNIKTSKTRIFGFVNLMHKRRFDRQLMKIKIQEKEEY